MKNVVFPLSFAIFLALLATPTPAQAEEPSIGSGFPGKGIRLRLELSYLMLLAQDNRNDILRNGIAISPRISFGKVLTFSPFARLTHELLKLHKPKNLPADASLSLASQPSFGVNVQLTVPVLKWLVGSLVAEYETPVSRKRMRLHKLTIQSPEDSPLDYNALVDKNDIAVHRSWNRFLVGGRLQFDLGTFRPYLEIGYRSFTGELQLTIDPKLLALLDLADINPDKSYDVDLETAYYDLGTDILLPKGFRCRVTATILPSENGFALFTGLTISAPSLTIFR